MILTAAFAVGFGVDRVPGWIWFPDLTERGNAGSRAFSTFHAIAAIHQGSVPFLAAWTVAFLAIRVRRPRPALRWCLREPGMVGCCAASVGLLVNALRVLVLAIAYSPDPSVDHFRGGNAIKAYAEQAGFAVIGSWVALALVRRWKPRPCWIDRIGRILGLLWIAMIGVHMAEYVVHAYVKLWMVSGG
jgi:hypothetical protein